MVDEINGLFFPWVTWHFIWILFQFAVCLTSSELLIEFLSPLFDFYLLEVRIVNSFHFFLCLTVTATFIENLIKSNLLKKKISSKNIFSLYFSRFLVETPPGAPNSKRQDSQRGKTSFNHVPMYVHTEAPQRPAARLLWVTELRKRISLGPQSGERRRSGLGQQLSSWFRPLSHINVPCWRMTSTPFSEYILCLQFLKISAPKTPMPKRHILGWHVLRPFTDVNSSGVHWEQSRLPLRQAEVEIPAPRHEILGKLRKFSGSVHGLPKHEYYLTIIERN